MEKRSQAELLLRTRLLADGASLQKYDATHKDAEQMEQANVDLRKDIATLCNQVIRNSMS